MADAFLGIRKDYKGRELHPPDLDPDPLKELVKWIDAAREAGCVEPSAFSLATSHAGQPSCRVILVRYVDARGVCFFTNYESRKGCELTENPKAALCAWWPQLELQVRVEGTVERLTGEESDAYFATRPYESQLASAVSPQSQVIESRAALEVRMATLRAMSESKVERPAHWGGYRLLAERFEFWAGRPARLHDRIQYRLNADGWTVERLAP